MPKDKRIEIGLRYIFGVGPQISSQILKKTGVNPGARVHELSDAEVASLRTTMLLRVPSAQRSP